ncbi:MAG: MBOAT family protein [Cryomorphaceae bacterium]|nr:MBOAT family protein [Flavobacteriales bacterium]
MLFNSIDFLVFLPITVALYWLIGRLGRGPQTLFVLFASYVFYGWWDWRFLGLIMFSTVVDFFVGKYLMLTEDAKRRKWLLFTSVFVNLGFLGFFKYFNFFLDSFTEAFTFFGGQVQGFTLQIVLPVGISFFTFQTMSYTIDIYQRRLEPTKDFIAFAAFVGFFPQLVAGPIERASNMIPQFTSVRTFKYRDISAGVKMMLWGFFMKIVVADRAGIYVDAVYGNVAYHEGLSYIAATCFFAFQVYCDFAGYSLIAIGSAKLFGFDLMTNFRRPNFARSCAEYWSRWHISLSTWFRDYLYIPLGGNRVSKPRLLYNIFITFLISGLWHGSNWTFVIWGGINGIYLVVEILIGKKKRNGLHNIFITFLLINFTRIFFRANDVNDAFHVVKTICTNPGKLYIGFGADVVVPIYALLGIGIVTLVEIKQEYFNEKFSLGAHPRQAVRLSYYAAMLFAILYIGVFTENQFIYFQF